MPNKIPKAAILVCNTGDTGGVQRFDARTGRFRGAFISADQARLPFPDTIIPGPGGYLYVSGGCRATPGIQCDAGLSVIQRYDAETGGFVDTFSSSTQSPLNRPYGFAFGPDGLLYAASFMGNAILRYDNAGRFVDEFAVAEEGNPTGLNGPNSLVFDDRQYLYVTTEGSLPKNGKPTFPRRFKSVVLRYDLRTREQIVFANPSSKKGASPSLDGIRFGPGGNLFVSDFSLNLIRVFDGSTGIEVHTLSTLEPSLAKQYTGSIAFDSSGALFVTVGSQAKPNLGAVLRFSGKRLENRRVIVEPTPNLDRPGGIIVR